ncbi:MAG: DUF805 domain-containing protein [Brevundimonas sp.]|uniref:DUF805 domain-containing protein n=1 Tax=Brevundimonas sp. TaxID=1871086 RepID=UPI00391CC913
MSHPQSDSTRNEGEGLAADDRLSAGTNAAVPGVVGWSELLLSSTGRTGRLRFWLGLGVLMAGFLALEALALYGYLPGAIAFIGYLALGYMGLCLLAKRLHDRGRSGWWAGLVLLAFVMVWPWPAMIWDFAGFIVLGWAIVELLMLGGEDGHNRFGPPTP